MFGLTRDKIHAASGSLILLRTLPSVSTFNFLLLFWNNDNNILDMSFHTYHGCIFLVVNGSSERTGWRNHNFNVPDHIVGVREYFQDLAQFPFSPHGILITENTNISNTFVF